MSRRPQAVRRAAAAALLPLALGSLAACGGDEKSATGTDEPSTSTESEASQAAAGLEAGDDVEKQEFLDIYEAALEDATTAEMTLTTKAQGMDIEAEGDVDYTTTPPSMAMEMEMPGAPEPIDMRLVDGVMYMTIPGATQDGKFIKLDLNDPNNPFGSMMNGQMDPRAQIDTFAKGLTGASYVGSEDVDGEEMDRYALVVDTAAMFEAMEMDAQTRELAMQQAPKTIDYEIWIDGEGLFRQMTTDMGGTLGSMQMNLDEWGTDVEIEAPPAGQVSDKSLAELMGGAPGAAPGA